MRAGTLIAGRYRLTQPLGAGSMGQVWRARDERLQRDVAVKVVDLASASGPVSPQQVQREVLATARLNHPSIVTTFDGGVESHLAYLVMELLDGESLAERLRRGPLPVEQAVAVAAEVGRALEATHLIGVVHRDIKPGNVMLLDRGRVKVLDFGIARLAGDPTEAPGSPVVGTAAYMAPEHAAGQPVGPPSDVYALGCLIVAMLAGRPPFLGATTYDVAEQQVHGTPPRLCSLRPDAPAPLDALVARMLAKSPSARPDAATVVRELGHVGQAPGSGSAATAALPAPVPWPVPAGGAASTAFPIAQGTSVLSEHGPATAVLSGGGTSVLPGQGSSVPPGQGTAVLPGQGTAVLPGQGIAPGAPGAAVPPGAAAWAPPTHGRPVPLPPPGVQPDGRPTAGAWPSAGAAVPPGRLPSPPPSATRLSATGPGRPGGPGNGTGKKRNWGYWRLARTIIIAMLVLLASGALVQGVPRLLAALPKPGTPTSTPTRTTPKPTRSTTTTAPARTTTTTSAPRPTLPSTLPSIPDPGQAALQGAVAGVTSVLDSWSPATHAQETSKARLTSRWAQASRRILAGRNAQQALDGYVADVRDERDAGGVPPGIFGTLLVALAAVDVAV